MTDLKLHALSICIAVIIYIPAGWFLLIERNGIDRLCLTLWLKENQLFCFDNQMKINRPIQ